MAHLSEPPKAIKSWVGNASWYGPGFNGRKTANGEIFDSEALTAAHPHLPFGSLVRVTHCPMVGVIDSIFTAKASPGSAPEIQIGPVCGLL